MKIPRATDEFHLTIPPEVDVLETYDGLNETLIHTPIWRFNSNPLLQTFLPASLDIGVERVGETNVYLLTLLDYTIEFFDHPVLLDAADGLFDLRYVSEDLLIASRSVEPVEPDLAITADLDNQVWFTVPTYDVVTTFDADMTVHRDLYEDMVEADQALHDLYRPFVDHVIDQLTREMDRDILEDLRAA